MSVETLMKQIGELPETEREQHLDRLFDEYGEAAEPIEISDGMRKLLEERNAEYEANPNAGYTWEEVVAHIKRQK